VSRPRFSKWRGKYAGATLNGAKRLRELEAEKAKRMCAELALENGTIKDVLSQKL
jgi:hypothetical protein